MDPCTPTHTFAAISSNRASQLLQIQRQDTRKSILNKVKQLFLEHRYKQCAALCEDTLKTNASELQPLHKTFLHFFAAICYESLGQAAHNYSSNKLPFLNLAQQAFMSAKLATTLPCESADNRRQDSAVISCAVSDFLSGKTLDINQSGQPLSTCESPSAAPPAATRIRSFSAPNKDSHCDARPRSHILANSDDYLACQPSQGMESLSVSEDFQPLRTDSGHGLHPCLSLETPEPQSEVAPKPLVSKRRAIVLTQPALPRKVPLIPPRCALRTTQRQTALQASTVVNQYESLSTSPNASCPPTSFYVPVNSSSRLARYNTDLLSFHTRLSAHLASVSDDIRKTTVLQQEHKAERCKRLASYWMLSPALQDSEEADRKAGEKNARIDRLRQNGWRVNKERFGWKGEEYYRELRRRVEVELTGMPTNAN